MNNKPNINDCQDQYFECASECSTDDQECHDECVTDLKECDVPSDEDVHAKQKEQYYESYEVDTEGIIKEMLTLAALLGGTMERYDTLNSTGKSSKVIQIEYDVKHKNTT